MTIGKLVLANLDTIVTVVRPAFTRKKLDEVPDRNALLNQQIAELQAAAASNAEQVARLAEQLREVVEALAQSAAEAAALRAAHRRMTQVALALAGVALLGSIAALWSVLGGVLGVHS
jgi:hypothetical protein